jgi:hypothetical protein
METLCNQSRCLDAEELTWIRQLICGHPQWGRFQLSVHIAQEWNWRNGAGQLKDMAARTLLLKLERQGLLQLPRRQRGGGSRPAQPPVSEQLGLWTEPLLEGSLAQVRPVQLAPVPSSVERGLLSQLLQQYHYLGYRRPVGENLQYLARDRAGRPLACLVFGAAAWQCAPRDQFIGWSQLSRQGHLHLLANHMRFLMLPWVRVAHLASHLLGLVAARLSGDWQAKYGHEVGLLESFVERDRFQGGCYRAANWIWVGQTQGRSRNDRERSFQVPRKDVYVYPLRGDWRRALPSEPSTPTWK